MLFRPLYIRTRGAFNIPIKHPVQSFLHRNSITFVARIYNNEKTRSCGFCFKICFVKRPNAYLYDIRSAVRTSVHLPNKAVTKLTLNVYLFYSNRNQCRKLFLFSRLKMSTWCVIWNSSTVVHGDFEKQSANLFFFFCCLALFSWGIQQQNRRQTY